MSSEQITFRSHYKEERKLNIVFSGEQHESGTSMNMSAVKAVCECKWQERGGFTEQLHFTDCGSKSSKKRDESLRRADIIYMNLTQSDRLIKRYFEKFDRYREKTVYIISNYNEEKYWNKERIEKSFRIDPSKIYVVPFDNGFRNANIKGQSKKFIDRMLAENKVNVQKNTFIWNVCKAAELIYEKTELQKSSPAIN